MQARPALICTSFSGAEEMSDWKGSARTPHACRLRRARMPDRPADGPGIAQAASCRWPAPFPAPRAAPLPATLPFHRCDDHRRSPMRADRARSGPASPWSDASGVRSHRRVALVGLNVFVDRVLDLPRRALRPVAHGLPDVLGHRAERVADPAGSRPAWSSRSLVTPYVSAAAALRARDVRRSPPARARSLPARRP